MMSEPSSIAHPASSIQGLLVGRFRGRATGDFLAEVLGGTRVPSTRFGWVMY